MNRKALIIEDDPAIGRLVAMHLEDADCTSTVVADGRAGLERFRVERRRQSFHARGNAAVRLGKELLIISPFSSCRSRSSSSPRARPTDLSAACIHAPGLPTWNGNFSVIRLHGRGESLGGGRRFGSRDLGGGGDRSLSARASFSRWSVLALSTAYGFRFPYDRGGR